MDMQEIAGPLFVGLLIIFFIAALPIIISFIFLIWRRHISTSSLKKRGILKAPLTALVLNGTFTISFIVIQIFVGLNQYFSFISIMLILLTILLWVHDSLSWRKIKKGTPYFTLYIIGSVCLILVLLAFGAVDGVRIYNDQTQAEAKGLAAVRSIGTQLYLPKDMTDTIIYIRPTADKKHSYLDISKIPLEAYQYNNIFIPSKLHCYPDNPGSYDPNVIEEPSGCTYMGKINGMEVWGYTVRYSPDAGKIQHVFARIGTTTIVIDDTPDNALSYIKSLYPATNEEVNKY